uniref:Uncharacterized protein n=1 Tax=Rhodnius prolixus TaxID=13249 RepID=T1HHA4_RHOPR
MKKLLAMWAEGSYLIVLTALIRSYSSEFYLFDPIKEAIHVNQVVKEEVKNRLRDQEVPARTIGDNMFKQYKTIKRTKRMQWG